MESTYTSLPADVARGLRQLFRSLQCQPAELPRAERPQETRGFSRIVSRSYRTRSGESLRSLAGTSIQSRISLEQLSSPQPDRSRPETGRWNDGEAHTIGQVTCRQFDEPGIGFIRYRSNGIVLSLGLAFPSTRKKGAISNEPETIEQRGLGGQNPKSRLHCGKHHLRISPVLEQSAFVLLCIRFGCPPGWPRRSYRMPATAGSAGNCCSTSIMANYDMGYITITNLGGATIPVHMQLFGPEGEVRRSRRCAQWWGCPVCGTSRAIKEMSAIR